jgi:hypothetical protein
MLPCFHVASTIQTGLAARDALRAQLEVKKFGNGLFRFAALKPPKDSLEKLGIM